MVDVVRKVFGKSLHVRLVEFLFQEEWYGSQLGLARRLGVSYPTLHKVVRDLENVGLIRRVRIGNSYLILLNSSSPLLKTYSELLDRMHYLQKITDELNSRSVAPDSD